MASTDSQILAAGFAPSPLSYVVPNAQELEPLAINAMFDGTGAAGPFVPTLEIVSDAGIVMARVPVGQTFNPGEQAAVTWAPFLESSAQTPTFTPNLPYAIAYASRFDPEIAVPTGVTKATTFVDFETSDPSLFSFPAGKNAINTSADMLIMVYMAYLFDYALTLPAQWLTFEGQVLAVVGFDDAAPYEGLSGFGSGLYGPGPGSPANPPIALFGIASTRTGKTLSGSVAPAFTNNSGQPTSLKLSERLMIVTCLALT